MEAQTKPVKDRLARSLKLQEKLRGKLARLDALERKMLSPSSPRLDGMPHSGGRSIDREADLVALKVDTEAEIRELRIEIRKERQQLAELFANLNPDEELVCTLRYIDGLCWRDVVAAIYDGEEDYEDEIERYTNKMFKAHGKAILNLIPFISPEGEAKQ